eukprot:8849908-Pyramimonas_sp.AAC.1
MSPRVEKVLDGWRETENLPGETEPALEKNKRYEHLTLDTVRLNAMLHDEWSREPQVGTVQYCLFQQDVRIGMPAQQGAHPVHAVPPAGGERVQAQLRGPAWAAAQLHGRLPRQQLRESA